MFVMDLEKCKRIEHVTTEKFCRLCFMKNDLLINFSEKVANDGLMISDILVKNLGLVLTDEELPKLVCSDCLEEVMQFDSIIPDVRETLAYMINRGKYLKMAFTEDQEKMLNPFSIKQDIKYLHESCFPLISEIDQRFFKKVCTNLDVGSSNPTFNKTRLCVGDNSEYKKQNSGSKFFYCKNCDDHFFHMDGLKHHFSLFHSKDNKYACGKCEKRFKSKIKLVKHIKKYDFQCLAKGCRVKEVIKSDSLENVTIVTNSNSEELVEEETEILKSNVPSFERKPSILAETYTDCESYLCSHCGASFVGKELLKGHLNSCPHAVNEANRNLHTKLSPPTSSHATNITSYSKDPDIWYKCDKCNETFPNRKHVICHLKEKHNADRTFMCRMCNVCFCSRHELGMHHSVHKGEKRKYTCKACGVNVNDKYYFKMHLMICRDKNIFFKCNICGKYFVTGGNLKMHYQTHFLERKYLCKYCPNRFKSNTTMHAHVRAVHLKVKPYECGICHKVFAKRNVMNNHFAIHSDERRFVCEVCKRGFKLKCVLVKHKTNVHKSNII